MAQGSTEQPGVKKVFREFRAIMSVHPGEPGDRVRVGYRSTREDGLRTREAPNPDTKDVGGVSAGEIAIRCLVVLTVIANQDPLDVRELCD
jgi:hypothetical protein